MKPSRFLHWIARACWGGAFLLLTQGFVSRVDAADAFRVGIIGLDTSHAIAFAKILNDPQAAEDVAGCRVVVAYPHGSPDIESSTSRIPQYTKDIQELGVEIATSIDSLLERVDGVLLETNDGRPHLEQARLVIQAGKPLFIDKPMAASLADIVAIFREADAVGVPVWSSSSLRYMETVQQAKQGSVGKVLGCDAYSPCALEPTHPDLFWYGIHGVEILYTAMGTGCEVVTRASSPEMDVVTGRWSDGRIGTFRGMRAGKSGYGGTVFGSDATLTLAPYSGYRPLLVEIVKFFRSGHPPVSAAETTELYAFMEAADESKRQGGTPVQIKDVIARANDAVGTGK